MSCGVAYRGQTGGRLDGYVPTRKLRIYGQVCTHDGDATWVVLCSAIPKEAVQLEALYSGPTSPLAYEDERLATLLRSPLHAPSN